MSELNRIGMSYRKVPQVVSEFGVRPRPGRVPARPFRPLDAVAAALLLGAALVMAATAIARAGFGGIPFILVFMPVIFGVTLMICRMGGPIWARVVASICAAGTLICAFGYGLWLT